MKIHIPSTPVIDVSPAFPPSKVTTKLRTIKTGVPTLKSPLIPPSPLTRLRLPASPAPEPIPATPATPRVLQPPKRSVGLPVSAPPKSRPNGRPPKPPVNTKPGGKPSTVPKAQSGGMSLNDLRASRNALKKLKANKHALAFHQPVDPIRDHAPKYVLGSRDCNSLISPF